MNSISVRAIQPPQGRRRNMECAANAVGLNVRISGTGATVQIFVREYKRIVSCTSTSPSKNVEAKSANQRQPNAKD
jgi:ribosomal protein L18